MNKNKGLVSKLATVGGTLAVVMFAFASPVHADGASEFRKAFNNKNSRAIERIKSFFRNLF